MYNFLTVKKIVAGPGAIYSLGKEVKSLNSEAEKVLIVTDKGIMKAGVVDKALVPLKKEGIKFEIFDEVEANPTEVIVNKAAQYLREINADVVIGIGGGSAMDVAKAIASLSCNEGSIQEYFSDINGSPDPFKNSGKPLIAVATTSGTGSEVTAYSMIDDTKDKKKKSLFTWQIAPAVAITDPLLTISLPPSITAATGMDALVHAVEAYITNGSNPFGDADAYYAIKLIVNNIRKAYTDGKNIEARANMMIGSTLAGRAIANVGLGIVHSLGQAIGGEYNAPHGLTMAVCLPIAMEYNFMTNPDKFADITKLMGKNTNGLSTLDAARLSIDAIRELLNDLNIKEDIRLFGVKEDSLSILAEKALICPCTDGNPRPINLEGFKQLFSKLYFM